MTTRADIRAAFKRHGPLSVSELATHCPSCECDRQVVASEIAALRVDGKVKPYGRDAYDKPVYTIDYWPDENESAAERATARASTPETTPSPASAAVPHQEHPMTKKTNAERVIDALKKHGACDLGALEKHTGIGRATLYTFVGKMKELKRVGRGTYELAGQVTPPQPPQRQTAAKPKKAARKPAKTKLARLKRKGPKRSSERAAPAPAAPITELNGNGAHFAINEIGELGITRGEGAKQEAMRLDAAEFARLRGFIERTQPVWKGAGR